MTAISIMVEGQDGLTWPRWQRLVSQVEQLGFAGLFRSDHFTNAGPPDKDSLELIVSLTYLATNTQRIHFGQLVSPFTFRHPAMLARQAAALDDLSGGRMQLGVGAGWQAREHSLFGFDLGDVPTRMARFEEGLEVITRLLRSDEPTSYAGRFFQLREATLLPRPRRPGGPPITIGGNGPKRTLPLAARYADNWNAVFIGPDQFRSLNATLDGLLRDAGRAPDSVKRTLMTGLHFGRDRAALKHKLDAIRARRSELAGKSDDQVLAFMRDEAHVVIGEPEQVRAQLHAYERAGVAELMLQWLDLDDVDGLGSFAEVARRLA